jgi:hypothetical protein
MCRNSRAIHHVLGLRWFVLAFLLVAALGDVYAAGKVRVTPQSNRWHRQGQNADGSTRWVQDAEFNATWDKWLGEASAGGGVAAASEYIKSGGPLSSSTIGSMGRKALRGGVYGAAVALAVEGVIDGAGWAIKELQDQVVEPGTPQEELGESAWCFFGTNGRPSRCASAPGLLTASANLIDPSAYAQPCTAKYSPEWDRAFYSCVRISDGVTLVVNSDLRVTRPITGWPVGVNDNPGTDDKPISDDQLGDAIRKDPQLVNALLTDPRTGRPVMTPELQQMMDDIKKQIEQREGIPGSEPTPAPDMEDDTAKDDGSPWPSFCGWATAVCDFIDWVKTDDPDTQKPEVPWEEEKPADFDQKWSSGLGGGSCPPPISVSVPVPGGSVGIEFSYEFLCQFATILRPLVIAMAAIMAAVIVAGVRGGSSA